MTHAAILLLVLFITAGMPDPTSSQRATSSTVHGIIWMPRPGPGGGGGGGGDGTADPPKRADAAGAARVTVRQRPLPEPAVVPDPAATTREPSVHIDALPTAAGLTEMPGVIASVPEAWVSLGPGSGGGAGGGRRGGSGTGDGLGVGPGLDRGSGGGPYQPGTNGVTFPRLIREVTPMYTTGALQARVQGIVELRAVVHADGSVGDVWVARSLDRAFGIDDEAVRTVKQWRFLPAMQDGRPVAVVVPIELRFTIR